MFQRHRRALFAVVLLAAAASTAFALVTAGYRTAPTQPEKIDRGGAHRSESGQSGQALRLPPEGERLEVEPVTVSPDGIEPAEITRPRGRFVLAVENRSGLEEVSLRLEAEAGARLREAGLSRRRLNWTDVLDLPPGRYLLTEANHGTWACRITVLPK